MPKSFRPSEGNIPQISQKGQALNYTVPESALAFDTATQAELDAHIASNIDLAHPNGSLPVLRVDGITGFMLSGIDDHVNTPLSLAHPTGQLDYGRVEGITGLFTAHSNTPIDVAHPSGSLPLPRVAGLTAALDDINSEILMDATHMSMGWSGPGNVVVSVGASGQVSAVNHSIHISHRGPNGEDVAAMLTGFPHPPLSPANRLVVTLRPTATSSYSVVPIVKNTTITLAKNEYVVATRTPRDFIQFADGRQVPLGGMDYRTTTSQALDVAQGSLNASMRGGGTFLFTAPSTPAAADGLLGWTDPVTFRFPHSFPHPFVGMTGFRINPANLGGLREGTVLYAVPQVDTAFPTLTMMTAAPDGQVGDWKAVGEAHKTLFPARPFFVGEVIGSGPTGYIRFRNGLAVADKVPMNESGTTFAETDGRYVLAAGDRMTGNLHIASGGLNVTGPAFFSTSVHATGAVVVTQDGMVDGGLQMGSFWYSVGMFLQVTAGTIGTYTYSTPPVTIKTNGGLGKSEVFRMPRRTSDIYSVEWPGTVIIPVAGTAFVTAKRGTQIASHYGLPSNHLYRNWYDHRHGGGGDADQTMFHVNVPVPTGFRKFWHDAIRVHAYPPGKVVNAQVRNTNTGDVLSSGFSTFTGGFRINGLTTLPSGMGTMALEIVVQNDCALGDIQVWYEEDLREAV